MASTLLLLLVVAQALILAACGLARLRRRARRAVRAIRAGDFAGPAHCVSARVQTDGTAGGTRLVDAGTGLDLRFTDCTASQVHMPFRPGDRRADVMILLEGVPLDNGRANGWQPV